jgi:hypothetical protein
MPTHITSKDREPLSGLVERVTFHSPESGFCVLRVKVRGNRELVTVLGSAASIQPGEFIQASGRWDSHREHGIQFKTTFLKVMPPSSLDGIEKYLGSGMIKGIHFCSPVVRASAQARSPSTGQPGRSTARRTRISMKALSQASGIAEARVLSLMNGGNLSSLIIW